MNTIKTNFMRPLVVLGFIIACGLLLCGPALAAQDTRGEIGGEAQADVVANAIVAYEGGATMKQVFQQALQQALDGDLDINAVVSGVQQQVQSIAIESQALAMAKANGRSEPSALDWAGAAAKVSCEIVGAIDAAGRTILSDPVAQARMVGNAVMVARAVSISAGGNDANVTDAIISCTLNSPNAQVIGTAAASPLPDEEVATYIPPGQRGARGRGPRFGFRRPNVPNPPPNPNRPGQHGPTNPYSSTTGGV